jgi:hypothetical protein
MNIDLTGGMKSPNFSTGCGHFSNSRRDNNFRSKKYFKAEIVCEMVGIIAR